jgi:hypothetical protein
MEDERPKFAHTMAYRFIESQIEKPLLGKPFISAKSLLIIQAMVLEQCSLLASYCRDKSHLIFRVLVASEGEEQKHIDVAKRFASELASPYAEFSNTYLELVCNQACGDLLNEDIAGFFSKLKGKLEPERAMPHVNVWAHIGAYYGLINYDLTELFLFGAFHEKSNAELSWKSASLKVDHFFLKVRAYYTPEMFKKETFLLFTEFCQNNYPEILHEFDFDLYS